MSKVKLENKILLIILFLSLTIFSVANFLHAAWQAPAGNPYSNNDSFPFIPSVGNDTTYVLDKHLGIDNNFIVGPDTTNALYINESANRTGVLTNDPQTNLDVWGVMRIGRMASGSFPPCNSDLQGTMIYNLTQNRLNVCVNFGWRRIGYDGDLDHWLDYADCNDSNASINPDSEICNDTVTNDCDALVNEGCPCTASEWSVVSCPDMSTCNTNLSYTPTKLTNCTGTATILSCPCVCRPEHFVAPLPPVCPLCRASAITLYSTRVSGVTCVDSNSISDTFCTDNCSGYCNGVTCCNLATYYTCSGTSRVYHDACGGTSSTVCTYGCSGGVCNAPPPCDGTGSVCDSCCSTCPYTQASCNAMCSPRPASFSPRSCTTSAFGTSCMGCICMCTG